MVSHTYELNASTETTTGVDIGIGGTAPYVQGEDVTLEFTVYESTGHSTNEDISAATAISWELVDPADGTSKLSKTKSGNIAFTNAGSDGKVDVPITQSDTSSLSPGSYQHQFAIDDDGSGNRTVAATGDFEITEDIA